MKNEDLKDLFDRLDFDIAEPAHGHVERFEARLNNRSKKKTQKSGIISLWAPVLGVAASLLLAVLIFQQLGSPTMQEQDLASVSPEMEQTQEFYSSLIKVELNNLDDQRSPETQKVIEDALAQLEILENDYKSLKKDLGKSGQDKRVIYAMISNFQKRIDLLKNVLEKVETINSLKNNRHENNII